jgi:hypothetical protein
MKFSLVLLSAVAATSSAFVAQQPVAFRSVSMQLAARAPAGSKEEDVELTRKVISDFMDGVSPAEEAPKEAAPAAVEEPVAAAAKEE